MKRILLILLALFALAQHPAAADEIADTIAKLLDADPKPAIAALAAADDPKAKAVLAAIANGTLFKRLADDAVVIGDGRKFLSCLVMIDQDNVAKFAQDKQVPYTDFASLTRAPEVVALVKAEIEAVNAKLARVEQVKEFRLIQELLTAEDEELTPTMKLKRKVVARKYAPLIDEMYAG